MVCAPWCVLTAASRLFLCSLCLSSLCVGAWGVCEKMTRATETNCYLEIDPLPTKYHYHPTSMPLKYDREETSELTNERIPDPADLPSASRFFHLRLYY